MAKVYKELTKEELENIPSDCKQAAHTMIYTKMDKKLFELYPITSTVMMQMRFDGTLGFVGGIIDDGETPETACTRECCEELGIDPSVLSITRDHYLFTHYSDHTKYCLHFFAIEVPYSLYCELEKKCTVSKDWGEEVMGIIRCPTYTLPNGLGLPAFLKHDFIGNARTQLLRGLEVKGLVSKEHISDAIRISNIVDSVVTVKNSLYDENMETIS